MEMKIDRCMALTVTCVRVQPDRKEERDTRKAWQRKIYGSSHKLPTHLLLQFSLPSLLLISLLCARIHLMRVILVILTIILIVLI